jgi:glyoxylase-like metal-dependent hydrolase (beta-lactamase superfamily II)
MGPWLEIADRVFVRRYRFFDQTIGAILGRESVAVIDTRTTPAQARETIGDLRELTRLPHMVVNTHGHFDHAWGNATFRPCTIWGHERCVRMIVDSFERKRAMVLSNLAALRDEISQVVPDPPDRTFDGRASVDLGGREIELRYLGRGHTDNDIVITVADAGVLFAGDLLENGATPSFGDAYPIEWPATTRALRDLVTGPVVPGHGEPADMTFVDRQLAEFEANAALARRVHAGELDADAAIPLSPYPVETARQPLERAVAQLRGELDEGAP